MNYVKFVFENSAVAIEQVSGRVSKVCYPAYGKVIRALGESTSSKVRVQKQWCPYHCKEFAFGRVVEKFGFWLV